MPSETPSLETSFSEIAQFLEWFTDRRAAAEHRVTKVPLDQLDAWQFEPATGNLVHRSGRFFSVEGLDIQDSGREVDAWRQPIICQPEFGILGILVRHVGGVPYFLLQAKMEPGNINLIQVSPTVQATRSNYTRVHGGRRVPYLEHFIAPRDGRVRHDALQSEQASWFLAKRNRNMIVELRDDDAVEMLSDFCWVSIDLLGQLLAIDNLVNMDTRTVLSGATPLCRRPVGPVSGGFQQALAQSWRLDGRSHRTIAELLSWFTEAKCRCTMRRRRIPLAEADRWSVVDGEVTHAEGKHFRVIGVDVEASNREVGRWSQVMLQPCHEGIVAFLARSIDGVLHILVQARTETGAGDLIEMAPTVQCQPRTYPPGRGRKPEFLDTVLCAPRDRIRFDAVQSEEGGRFYHAQNRYLLVEVDESFPLDVPDAFTWMTLGQLTEFVRFGNHLNVEARSLLAILGFTDLDAYAAGPAQPAALAVCRA